MPSQERIYRVTPNPEKKIRAGLYKCAECLNGFTVTVGTVCEDSHIPLNKWLIGFYMMCASKTQVSALQLQRQLEIGSYRSAWFMCHRIRFALQDIMPTDKLDGTVEADETYVGGKKRGMGRAYKGNKTAVVSLVERGGRVRSQVTPKVTGDALGQLLKQHVAETAHLNTDESHLYKNVGKSFASHDTVNHVSRGICTPRCLREVGKHEHRRGIFRQHQAIVGRNSSSGKCKAPAALPCRTRLQIQHTRRDGWRAHDDWHPEDRRQATDASSPNRSVVRWLALNELQKFAPKTS